MGNPFYIPAGPSVGERVAQPLTELMRIRQAGELGAEHNRLAGEDIALRSRGQNLQAQSLAETQRANKAKEPVSRQNFGKNEAAMFGQMLERLKIAKPLKFLTDDFTSMSENPGVDKGSFYGFFKQAWPEYQGRIVESLKEAAMDETQTPWMKQHYTKLADAIEKDKDGKLLDTLMPNVAMEWQAAQAEIESKSPQAKAYAPMTREQWLADQQALAGLKGTEDKTPPDLREFEIVTYGKEMPQLRGTPEYKDAMMGYMKSKRDATVAPSKADPAVLRKEFIGQSKDFVTIRDSYNRIKASVDKPSPAGDLSLIFNYMKMLDPGSVVRESEFATAASTGSYGERIKAAVGKVMSGEKLSDAMRSDFVNRSNLLYKSQLGSHTKLKEEYDRISKGMGVESSSVIIDYLTEQSDIQNEKYDIGEIYVGQDGTSRIYKGKDSTGKHIWIQVQ